MERSPEQAWHRTLTRAEHATIRTQIALVPVYFWLLRGWKEILLALPLGLPGTHVDLTRDFIAFYIPGVIANQRNLSALYDIDAWTAIIRQRIPGDLDLRFASIYGPQISLIFSPLARLPYAVAMTVWVGLSLVIFLGCGYAVWRTCPRLRDWKWTVLLLLLADPALHFTLAFAQISVLALLSVTGAFLALRANRPFLAGLAVGALVYKPQLGIAAAFVFVGAAEWRIVTGAVAGAAAELAGGCAFWGPSVLGRYVNSMIRWVPDFPREFEAQRFNMHSWRTFFALLDLRGPVAAGAYIAVAIIIAVATLQCWRAGGPLPVRFAMLLLATVLINPHIYAYDLILLAPAFLLIWDWALDQGDRTVVEVLPGWPFPFLRSRPFAAWFPWLLYACYFAPLLGVIGAATHVQVSVLVLSLLDVALFGALWPRSRLVAPQ